MKYAWIEHHRDEYTVSRLCRVLLVSRTGYCQWRVRPPSARALANEALDAQVATIHRDSRRSYGRPRITQQLRQQGQCVSAERVRRSLRRQGLRPVYRRAYVVTTDSVHRLPVAANILNRRFDGWQPNRAWVADITYVATYASHEYSRLAADFGITMSMSRKGNAWDNAAMESFFKTLKVERIYQVRYDTRDQARLDIVDWIEGFYNRVRIHSANGYLAPVTRERSLLAA